jgi:hypothetical protein
MAKINFQQFPNIFRTIPENKVSFVLISPLIIVLLLFVLILCKDIYSNAIILLSIANKKAEIKSKINFWKSIADKYDGYKDAYFQIAVLEYSLGNFSLSKQFVNKAFLLDPDFDNAKRLQEVLDK